MLGDEVGAGSWTCTEARASRSCCRRGSSKRVGNGRVEELVLDNGAGLDLRRGRGRHRGRSRRCRVAGRQRARSRIGVLTDAAGRTVDPRRLRRRRRDPSVRPAIRPARPRRALGGRRPAGRRRGQRAMLGRRSRPAPLPSFWSDQYGLRFQYVGHAEHADDVRLDRDRDGRETQGGLRPAMGSRSRRSDRSTAPDAPRFAARSSFPIKQPTSSDKETVQ